MYRCRARNKNVACLDQADNPVVLNGVDQTDLLYGDLTALGVSPADAQPLPQHTRLTLKACEESPHRARVQPRLPRCLLRTGDHVLFQRRSAADC